MLISDWSSDVCSSDLPAATPAAPAPSHALALVSSTPPTAQIPTDFGNTSHIAFKWPVPRAAAGNSLSCYAPSDRDAKASVVVMPPGMDSQPLATASAIHGGATVCATVRPAPGTATDL